MVTGTQAALLSTESHLPREREGGRRHPGCEGQCGSAGNTRWPLCCRCAGVQGAGEVAAGRGGGGEGEGEGLNLQPHGS